MRSLTPIRLLLAIAAVSLTAAAPTARADQAPVVAASQPARTPAPPQGADQAASGSSAATGGADQAATGSSAATGGASLPPPTQNAAPSDETQPGGGAPSPAAAVSSTTTQTISQVQIAGCTVSCTGTTQVQSAAQQNTMVQANTPAPSGGSAPVASAGTGSGPAPPGILPPGQTRVISQVQVGCQSHCYGATTTTPPLMPSSGPDATQIVNQVLAAVMPPGVPTLPPIAAQQFSVTTQTIDQSQAGGDATTVQTQQAAQVSATSQVSDPSSTAPASGASGASVGAVVNQVEQVIWQVQVGCLLDCTQTTQYQQAQQSDTTIAASAPSTAPAAGTADRQSDQVIWQLQIGCLFWCYDATELQTASQDAATTVAAAPLGASATQPAVAPSSASTPATEPPAASPVASAVGAPASPVIVTPQPGVTIASPAPASGPASPLHAPGPPSVVPALVPASVVPALVPASVVPALASPPAAIEPRGRVRSPLGIALPGAPATLATGTQALRAVALGPRNADRRRGPVGRRVGSRHLGAAAIEGTHRGPASFAGTAPTGQGVVASDPALAALAALAVAGLCLLGFWRRGVTTESGRAASRAGVEHQQ